MPLLPDFTVHDLIRKTDAVSNIKAGESSVGKVTLEHIEETKTIKEAITGEDGWVMTPVIKSTNILEIGYKEGKCRVKFHGMKLFEFEPISEELWLKFLTAKSKGEFFSHYIRNNKNIKAKQII